MKNVVITGSTRGIGFNLAKEFIKKGLNVCISGTTKEGVKKALEELNKECESEKAIGIKANVCDYKDVERLYAYAKKEFETIDIFINNAGVSQPTKNFFDLDNEDYKKTIDINVIGLMNGCNVAFREMIKQGHGFIYNMEGLGSDGMKLNQMIVYGTSKSAVTYFSKALAKEAKETCVKIGMLHPGMVITDMVKNGMGEDEEYAVKAKNIFSILGELPETVVPYLVNGILKNEKNGAAIRFSNNIKATYNFIAAKKRKARNLI